ncbi:hypothetical protein QT06_C0001G1270 [archaeon GW2011_AR15]|nr:hypothetical protein QT06_C0001G1270 [archaeon GW2011_AR15]
MANIPINIPKEDLLPIIFISIGVILVAVAIFTW